MMKPTNRNQYSFTSSRSVYLNSIPSDRIHDAHFPSNKLSTSKYNLFSFIPKNLYEQFKRIANLFFLAISLLQFFPQFNTIDPFVSLFPLLLIVFLTGLKDAVEDYKRHASDFQTNNQQITLLGHPWLNVNLKHQKSLKTFPLSITENWSSSTWESINVGDVVYISENQAFPADIILISSSGPQGICYIETKNLDGETNLKCKISVDCTSHLTTPALLSSQSMTIDLEPPNSNLYSFNGTLTLGTDSKSPKTSLSHANLLLRGCNLRNTEWIIGIVAYTGADTKIRLNSGKTPLKRSYNEKLMNSHVMFNLALMVFICLATCIPGTIIASSDSSLNRIWSAWTFTSSGKPSTLGDWIIQGVISFWVSIIEYQNLVPISLYLTIELVKSAQSFFIYQDSEMYYEPNQLRCIPKSWNLADDLGQIEYIFSDKTGTLTKNIMEFKLCSINGEIFGKESGFPGVFYDSKLLTISKNDFNYKFIYEFFIALALCHSSVVVNQNGQIIYKSQSPDESALINAAKDVSFALVERDMKTMTINVHGENEIYTILNIIEFDSTRKRMTVIVKSSDDKITLLCKGADTVIYERLGKSQDSIIAATSSHLQEFAADGFRTLCIASKSISKNDYAAWANKYYEASISLENREFLIEKCFEELENNLILLGATAIEDKLQDGVPDAIKKLSQAGIKIWVLTGDKLETAINIGYSCNLLTRQMNLIIIRGSDNPTDDGEALKQIQSALNQIENNTKSNEIFALVIDGRALLHALNETNCMSFLELATTCSAVVCCRVSPLQKAMVVQLVKNRLGAMCLAIGDGANDVSMIQAADIGVGISGEEGMQAVMSSDYAIAQFRFLERLLLVHGRWSYLRTSSMILYFFYKNITWVLPIFFFQFQTGFSGTSMFDFIYLLLYNTLFTGVPIIILGSFEKDLSDSMISLFPAAYANGIVHSHYNRTKFLYFIIDSIYQSFAIYIIFIFTFLESSTDLTGRAPDHVEIGSMMAIAALFNINIFITIISNSWNVILFAAVIFSIISVFGVTLILSSSPTSTLSGIASIDFENINFWFALLLSIALCHLPRMTFSYYESLKSPSDVQIILEQQKSNNKSEISASQQLAGDLKETQRRVSLMKRRQSIKSPSEMLSPITSPSKNLFTKSFAAANLFNDVTMDAMDPSDPSPIRTFMHYVTKDEIEMMRGFSMGDPLPENLTEPMNTAIQLQSPPVPKHKTNDS